MLKLPDTKWAIASKRSSVVICKTCAKKCAKTSTQTQAHKIILLGPKQIIGPTQKLLNLHEIRIKRDPTRLAYPSPYTPKAKR